MSSRCEMREKQRVPQRHMRREPVQGRPGLENPFWRGRSSLWRQPLNFCGTIRTPCFSFWGWGLGWGNGYVSWTQFQALIKRTVVSLGSRTLFFSGALAEWLLASPLWMVELRPLHWLWTLPHPDVLVTFNWGDEPRRQMGQLPFPPWLSVKDLFFLHLRKQQ